MSVHRLTESYVTARLRRVHLRASLNAAFFLCVSIFVVVEMGGSWLALLIVGPVLLTSVWMQITRMQRILRAYRVEWNDSAITVFRAGGEKERIEFSDIGKAAIVPGKGLLVESASTKKQIGIDANVEGFRLVCERVAQIVTIVEGRIEGR